MRHLRQALVVAVALTLLVVRAGERWLIGDVLAIEELYDPGTYPTSMPTPAAGSWSKFATAASVSALVA